MQVLSGYYENIFEMFAFGVFLAHKKALPKQGSCTFSKGEFTNAACNRYFF